MRSRPERVDELSAIFVSVTGADAVTERLRSDGNDRELPADTTVDVEDGLADAVADAEIDDGGDRVRSNATDGADSVEADRTEGSPDGTGAAGEITDGGAVGGRNDAGSDDDAGADAAKSDSVGGRIRGLLGL